MRVILAAVAACIVFVSLPVSAQAKAQKVDDKYMGLASGALGSASLVVMPGGVLLRSGDLKITQKELDAQIAKAPADIRAQLKNNEFFVLENHAIDVLLVSEARAWALKTNRPPNEDANTLITAYLNDLTESIIVTDEECKAFYDANKDMMGDATFDQVKDQLKVYIAGDKREDFVTKHVNSLSERLPVEVSAIWVGRQYKLATNNAVDKARKSGKATMVDFWGEGCQPCEMMKPIMEEIKKEYGGKMNILAVSTDKEQILAMRYGARVIPLILFFDKGGNEVLRQEGYFSREQIVAQFDKMGIK